MPSTKSPWQACQFSNYLWRHPLSEGQSALKWETRGEEGPVHANYLIKPEMCLPCLLLHWFSVVSLERAVTPVLLASQGLHRISHVLFILPTPTPQPPSFLSPPAGKQTGLSPSQLHCCWYYPAVCLSACRASSCSRLGRRSSTGKRHGQIFICFHISLIFSEMPCWKWYHSWKLPSVCAHCSFICTYSQAYRVSLQKLPAQRAI